MRALLNHEDYFQDSFEGLGIGAVKGVHALAHKMILNLNLPLNSKFLDLGAGEGAFSQRLIKAGYQDIDAVEIAEGKFKIGSVRCYRYDLNANFSAMLEARYNVVIALEIVEHLENPHHFLRECSKIIEKGGYLLLSTPHIESWVSRILFFIHGEHNWFSAKDIKYHGHITPIPRYHLLHTAEGNGYKLIRECATSNESLRKVFINSGGFAKKIMKTAFFSASYPLMRGSKSGDIKLYIFRRD